jgi:hypothetical protein
MAATLHIRIRVLGSSFGRDIGYLDRDFRHSPQSLQVNAKEEPPLGQVQFHFLFLLMG